MLSGRWEVGLVPTLLRLERVLTVTLLLSPLHMREFDGYGPQPYTAHSGHSESVCEGAVHTCECARVRMPVCECV